MSKVQLEDKIDQVKSVYAIAQAKAAKFLSDQKKLQVILDEAITKGERAKRNIQPAWEYLKVFCSLVTDSVQGKYTEVNKTHLVKIVAALVYFVSPVDVFPDFIPAFGFVDDIFIIGLVAAETDATIKAYKKAKQTK